MEPPLIPRTPSLVPALVLAAVLFLTGGAQAALEWEPIGPVPPTSGFTAVASDPQDSQVVWIGGGTSVYVSDDGGETFSLVLQLPRSVGVERTTGGGETLQLDPDDPTIELPDGVDDIDDIDDIEDIEDIEDIDDLDDLDDLDDVEGLDGLEDLEDGGEVESGAIAPSIEDADLDSDRSDALDDTADALENGEQASLDLVAASDVRFGIIRIRVLQDSVLVCTSQGLWTFPRSARKVGLAREIRLGRSIAVNDVARGFEGLLYVATDAGLWQVGADGLGRSVVGFSSNEVITAIVRMGRRLVVASKRGVHIQEGDGFRALGVLTGRERVSDLVALDGMRLIIVANTSVLLVLSPENQAPLVESSWAVPGVTRVATGRGDDSLWGVGGAGPWAFTPETGWLRRDEGLLDRRLLDVAASGNGPAFLYVVGRAGAARLVPETDRIWNKRAKFQAKRALDGLPTVEETLGWAAAARPIQLEDIDDWETEQRLAWLLPTVRARLRFDRARDEDFLFIPAIGRRILDEVRVLPEDDEFRIEARWNFMPAILLAVQTAPGLRSARTRARRAQHRIRSTVLPLYNTWLERRVRLVATEYSSVRAAVRDLIAVEQMEADLHVYTNGSFPIIGVTQPSAQSERESP